ncbi:hypothetical protein M426DRAFT_64203 [Hypoxylon sp. CI-4A]|nr:hypothetical protein M426DRAFT_64203 [Hypoxylon sp. CI-4A]
MRYRDAGIGLAFVILNQLLVLPIQIALDLHSINLPASILVMLLFSILMITANFIHSGTVDLYSRYLRGPTDFLGKHMSLGFVASFIMLNRDHISNAIDVPRVAGAFITTNVLGYVSSFLFAIGCYKLEYRIRRQRAAVHDVECGNRAWPSPSTAWPAPPTDRSPKRLSQLSRISMALAKNGSLTSMESAERATNSQLVDHLVRTAPVWICVVLIIAVGLPVYFATRYEGIFEALCFSLFWVLSLQLQRSMKASCRLLELPRLRYTLVIFANPVVVTSVLGTAYLWIKKACTGHTIDVIITQFRRHNTLAEGMIRIVDGEKWMDHVGAGDFSGLILDAGIVCMGFKMFEYRKELWESFITVLSTCTILAAANVFLSVLIARGMGLQAADALAFAARSVTIALGIPVMQNLDGSATLMSAMVVFGGIIFQMAGDWIFSILGIHHRQRKSSSGDHGNAEQEPQQSAGTDDRIIAAGVAVGINAAAMGTSHLIERDSRATAYSALSMTVFGAMTVALTAPPSVSAVIASLASR